MAIADHPRLLARSRQEVNVGTKAGTAPSSADRLPWRSGHRPDRISKCATGLALLGPDLPDHPWHRPLHTRLAVATPTPH